MKASSWFLGGLATAVLAGLVFLGVGLFRPGQLSEVENSGGTGKPLLAEAKKKAEVIRQARAKAAEVAKGLTALKGGEGEHRVFVSAQLVYLPENVEPVQPLDPKMVTEDGIGVVGKFNMGLIPPIPGCKTKIPTVTDSTTWKSFRRRPIRLAKRTVQPRRVN